MRHLSSALVVVLLLSESKRQNGIKTVAGFQPSSHGKSSTCHVVRAAEYSSATESTSSPLPGSLRGSDDPRTASWNKASAKRRFPSRKRRSHWNGQRIPKDIPSLSDVMKDASVEHFSGTIDSRNMARVENVTVAVESPDVTLPLLKEEAVVQETRLEIPQQQVDVPKSRENVHNLPQQQADVPKSRGNIRTVSQQQVDVPKSRENVRNVPHQQADAPKSRENIRNSPQPQRDVPNSRATSRNVPHQQRDVPNSRERRRSLPQQHMDVANSRERRRNLPRKQESAEPLEPWKANYVVSSQTQAQIKAVASNMMRNQPIERASAILNTLLSIPPEKCNEANVVCALTLSAKAMGSSTAMTKDFRSLLQKSLEILHQLVMAEQLSARQLCNAVWAIAKHYNLDPSILPPPPEVTAMSSEVMLGVAEAWILQPEKDDTKEQRVKDTIDAIATQITNIIQNKDMTADRKPKVGELSMASWAYGVLRPRRRPPGWSVPPQIGHLPQASRGVARKPRNVEFITFEQWTRDHDENESADANPLDSIDRLFDAIGDALCHQDTLPGDKDSLGPPLLQSCAWSEIANVAWAFAHHGSCRTLSSQTVMQRLAREASYRLMAIDNSQFRQQVLPRDVAQLVWSIGTLQSDNFRLGDDLVNLVDAISRHYEIEPTLGGRTKLGRPFQRWSCPDLVQLAISLAHGRIEHLPLLQALYREAYVRLQDDSDDTFVPQDRRKTFRTWEVSVLLWAQARLYLREPQGDVFEQFSTEAPKWLYGSIQSGRTLEEAGLGPQEQANLAWSFTVLEQFRSISAQKLMRMIFQEASSSSETRHTIQLEHAHQLWQALFFLEQDCPSAVDGVPKWFRDFLQEKWTVEKSRQKKSSARHRSLSQTLELMGVAHYNEHDEDIDVAIVLKEDASWTHLAKRSDHNGARYKVAVEFDGPNHFTREKVDPNGAKSRPRTLGHTVLKYRLLKRQGWTVVRVPYFEFDKIPFWASMERQRYLQRLLKTHANIRFSDLDISEYSVPVSDRKSRFD